MLPSPASPPGPNGPSSPSSGGHPWSNAACSYGRTPCPSPQHGAPGCPPEPPGAAVGDPPADTPPLWETRAPQGTRPRPRRCSPACEEEGGNGNSWPHLCIWYLVPSLSAMNSKGFSDMSPPKSLLSWAKELKGQVGASPRAVPLVPGRYLLWRAAVESDQELETEMSLSGMVRSCMPRA